MGFHRRYIFIENLLYSLKNDLSLDRQFNSEALIFSDKESERIFDLYKEGLSNKEILEKLNYENNQRQNRRTLES
jgi:DNA-binding NarL/FixJ family response regulator